MKPPALRLVRYSGWSMCPCFQDGDLLEVKPLHIRQARRGDCIVYRSDDGSLVIHRVISAGAVLITRGDAMPRNDTGAVAQDRLVGKVIHRYRLGAEKRVTGGWLGLLVGRFCGAVGRLDPLRPSRGGTIARQVRQLSVPIVGKMGSPGEIRTVWLAGQAPIVVWYWGKIVIGRHDPPSGEWSIYWPWRVILKAPRTEQPPDNQVKKLTVDPNCRKTTARSAKTTVILRGRRYN